MLTWILAMSIARVVLKMAARTVGVVVDDGVPF